MTAYRARRDDNEWVQLTDAENDAACRHALAMRLHSVRHGHHDHRASGYKPYNEEIARRIQCLGACGEAAIRKWLGYAMDLESENFREADLPNGIEVKVIGVEHYGLRVTPRTDDSRIVVGVVIPVGREREAYRLPGWIKAADAKRDIWGMAPWDMPPMWAVPQTELHPMSSFPSFQ